MRLLVKWYFSELLGYLIMSFTSIPVIDNDTNKPKCIFSSTEMFYVETYLKETKRFYLNIIRFKRHCVFVVMILKFLNVGNIYKPAVTVEKLREFN